MIINEILLSCFLHLSVLPGAGSLLLRWDAQREAVLPTWGSLPGLVRKESSEGAACSSWSMSDTLLVMTLLLLLLLFKSNNYLFL